MRLFTSPAWLQARKTGSRRLACANALRRSRARALVLSMVSLLERNVRRGVAHREHADQQAGHRDQRRADPDDGARRVAGSQRAGGEGGHGDAEVAGCLVEAERKPRRAGPARSIFITTVIDQASP